MADKLTATERSRNMAAIRSKGMKPELAVRKAAHAAGFRFRLHRKDLRVNRIGVPEIPGGDLRAWLLLASASRAALPRRTPAQI